MRSEISAPMFGLAFTFYLGMGPAIAYPVTEMGDAGELIPTAQILPGGTTSVSGSLLPTVIIPTLDPIPGSEPDFLAQTNDRDLYRFNWGGGFIFIDVILDGSPFALRTSSDTFLFDEGGNLLSWACCEADEDVFGHYGYLRPGIFYVSVGQTTAVTSSGESLAIRYVQGIEFSSVLGRINYDLYTPCSVRDCALAGWVEQASGFAGYYGDPWAPYTIVFSSAVPEPATLAVFGLSLAGLGLAARRRRTA